VATLKASDKLKTDIEKEREDQKSKKKSAESVGSDVVLQNNPFAAVKKAGGLQSALEIQAKVNQQKGANRNADHNEAQKEKGSKSPTPAPKVKPPKKPKQQQKSDLRGSDSASESQSATEPAPPSIGVNPQPVLVGAFAIALVVMSYVFLSM